MTEEYRLDDERRARLAAVLDALVPPDPERGLPGAGEVCVDMIEQMLQATPTHRLIVEPGLDAFGSRESGVGSREEALELVQREQPAFVPTLVFLAYSAYYQHPRVVEALGLEARPPHPRGYPMQQSDLDRMLAKVRARGPIYRKINSEE